MSRKFNWCLWINVRVKSETFTGTTIKCQYIFIYYVFIYFCSAIQYILSKTQLVGSAYEELPNSSEIVFDEAHFTVNLHNFLQPLALRKDTFSPSESFVPHSPRQNNFQNSSPLDTSEEALVCIFSSILNHS